jgi:hypothetical protein
MGHVQASYNAMISLLSGSLNRILLEESGRRYSRALPTLKTLSGFDFSFQPSLDRGRIMALAELKFIDRSEAVHFGPPGTGKSHSHGLVAGRQQLRMGQAAFASPKTEGMNVQARCVRRVPAVGDIRHGPIYR